MVGAARALPHLSTQGAVIDVIRAAGTISRAGLIERTGLTGATISTVVRRLIDLGLVLEAGRAESTGGKPRVLLRLNDTARYAIGVHLDRSGVVYVLTTLGGTVVALRPGTVDPADEPDASVTRMAADVEQLIETAAVDRDRVLGLGLVSAGPLAPLSGVRLTPTLMRQWKDFPLGRALQDAVGLPVLLENDATAAALGEHWAGRAGPDGTFAAVYMGTGIGSGIIINGGAFSGVSGNAGEFGHICLDRNGPECWCGSRGCLEVLAGPVAVVAAARADPDIRLAAELADEPSPGTATADFDAVTMLALHGHVGARQLLEDSADYLGRATRSLANVLDIDLIVLTGPSFAAAGSIYGPVIQAELDRSHVSRATHRIAVVVSPVARTAAAVGGAALVLQAELVPQRSGLRLPTQPEVPHA